MIEIKEKGTVICPSCRAENPVGKKFCTKCGSSLPVQITSENKNDIIICPSCGTENSKGKNFCIKCGARLARTNDTDPAKSVHKQSVNKKRTFSTKRVAVIAAAVAVTAGAVLIKMKTSQVPSDTEITYDNEIANITEVPAVETETSVSQTSEETTSAYETSAYEKEENSSNTSSDEYFEYTTVRQVTAVTTTAKVTAAYETSSDEEEEADSLTTSSEEYFEYTTAKQTTAVTTITEVTTVDEVVPSLTEWKIDILENYYNNEIKYLTEFDSYEITGANEPYIYDFTGNGDVILLCKLIVPIGGLDGSVTIGCAVDDSGNVTTEKIVDNTGGGVVYEEYAIVKNSVNNKLYYKYSVHGLSQYNETTYAAVDKTEEIRFLMPGLGSEYEFIVDGYPVTMESYSDVFGKIGSVMTEPVPTRTDGDISVYIHNPLAENNKKPSAKGKLLPPQNFKAEIIDGETVMFSWDEIEGDDIIYTVYKLSNGEYTEVLDTEFTYSFLVDNEEADYCVTAKSDDYYVEESDFSDISKAKNDSYENYSAADFIGVSYADLYDYSQSHGGYNCMLNVSDYFTIEGIPYTFFGALLNYDGSLNDSEYGFVRGINVNNGDKIAEDIIFDDNAAINLAEKYNCPDTILKIEGAEGGGILGITVQIDIGNNTTVSIIYPVPSDIDYFSFESELEYGDYVCEMYDGKKIAIKDIDKIFDGDPMYCIVFMNNINIW